MHMLFSRNSESGQIESYTDEGIFAGFVSTMGDFISSENENQSAMDGGPGSGNFGHKGRPGKRGGSAGKESGGSGERYETGRPAEYPTGGAPESAKLKEPGDNYEDLQEVEIDPDFDIFEFLKEYNSPENQEKLRRQEEKENKERKEKEEREEKIKKERETYGQNGLLESEYPEDLRFTDEEKKKIADLFRSYKDDNFKSDVGADVRNAMGGLMGPEDFDKREKRLREIVAETTEEIERKKAEGYTYKTHNPQAHMTRKQKLGQWWNEVMTTGAPTSNWEEKGIRYWQLLRSGAMRHLKELDFARKVAGRNEFAKKSDNYMPWIKNPHRDDPSYKPWKKANDGGPGSGNFGHAGNPGHVGGSAPGGRVIPRARESESKPVMLHGKRGAKVTMYRDVTSSYKRNAKPGEGKFEIDPRVNREKRSDDIAMAEWLYNEFGGDIKVLGEEHDETGKKNPDFLWNGRLWDLKTPDQPTFNAINKRQQTGIRQIRRNPGGIIMDLNKCGASLEDAEIAVANRMYTSADFAADVIILHKGNEYKILRFE